MTDIAEAQSFDHAANLAVTTRGGTTDRLPKEKRCGAAGDLEGGLEHDAVLKVRARGSVSVP